METFVKTRWAIDPTHSEIAFKVKHMMISTVTGHFENFDAAVETEGEDFRNARVNFTAQIDSINTKSRDRNRHLKSEDFFNAKAYPDLTFKSQSFDGERLTGDLTIRGISKEVTLNVNLNGMAVTEAGSIVVSDKVKLAVDVQFIRQE